MSIQIRQRSGVTFLQTVGRITIGQGDIELRDAVDSAIEAGSRRIVVDLEKATAMDSSGIAELVAAKSSVHNSGGALKLLNLPAKIQDVLGVTQLITVFDVFDDEEEAIRSFDEELVAVGA